MAREQSRLSISLTSGCCTVASRKSSGNLAPEVHVVHARGITNGMVFTNANKHFYQLQNDSPARGSSNHADSTRFFPTLIHPSSISPIYRNQPLPPPLSTRRRRTFDHPHSPCNLENDRAEPRASQIFDTRKLGKERKGRGLSNETE